MLIDLVTGDREMTAETDVCVIGAGAAGIAVTRDLQRLGRDVCLLEAGGLDFDSETQKLCSGSNLGHTYYDLDEARLRFFGGTTNIWGGRCVPLDRIDFERRDWIPFSGWPISREDLDPWYRLAHESLELGEFEYSAALWSRLSVEPLDFSAGELGTAFWRFDAKKERFSSHQCDDLIAARNARIFLHANLTHIRVDGNSHRIRSVAARSLQSHSLVVHARHFVLACGAIENARQLLLSDDVMPGGIGNAHDQVGRYFMEHPHGRIAEVETRDPVRFWAMFRKRYPSGGPPVAPALVCTESLQRRAATLNSAATFKLQRDPRRGLGMSKKMYAHVKHRLDPDRSGRRLWHVYRGVLDGLQKRVSIPLVRIGVTAARLKLYLTARAEQAPNPDSRVVLTSERDSLGCRLAALDWRLSEIDKRSVRELSHALDRQLRQSGIGKATTTEWLEDASPEWPYDPTVGNHPIGGYHHMGTTRMSASPLHGVVDADCTVHGLGNLHIAGSSVFATGGWANPTLTILALAQRLAKHIDALLIKG